jgi:hypothetical protein
VALVNVTEVGVPKTGVTNVGEVVNTIDPEPDTLAARAVATPVPNPESPVETGNPVAFVKVAELGVPRAGVTSVGLVAKTTLPDPVVDAAVMAVPVP